MADDLIRCRTTMRPWEWLHVTPQEREELRLLGILLEGPTQQEIAQQVADQAAAAAPTRKRTTATKGKQR